MHTLQHHEKDLEFVIFYFIGPSTEIKSLSSNVVSPSIKSEGHFITV